MKCPAAKVTMTICTRAKLNAVSGEPEANHTSTSFVGRQNLTMRMGMRRFTPNAFWKKARTYITR